MSVPITLLTGFLGSGKTTYLNRLLRAPSMRDALVLVNEVGEVSVDHLLVRQVDERMVVLPSGCVCCALREDLVTTLADPQLVRGRTHVVVETSGLADPTPLIATIVQHPRLRHRFHLGGVVVALDATTAAGLRDRYPEAPKQLALADLVILTKCDLATAEQIRAVEVLARATAPDAEVRRASADGPADYVLPPTRHVEPPVEDGHVHTHGVRTFSVESSARVRFSQLALWLSMMSQLNGERLLRFKGLVRVTDHDSPVVVQAVQHVVYPTYTLPSWPDGAPRTRLTAITHGMSEKLFEDTRASLLAIVAPEAKVAAEAT
ncbi:MAG TPA: GTP-binding protein [Sandaracinaceae bacterium LLY-WYZ-13_1]|nr:GTP-binding protein [Sandaracinaceae bacterium LLY-WYZ-13_1]